MGVHRFKVGKFTCYSISDGFHEYAPPMFPPPAALLFSNADHKELAASLHNYQISLSDWNSWRSDYTCLLVDTGSELVLFDTGAGTLAETTGQLIGNLRSINIFPEDVGFVVISHCHPDHINGVFLPNGDLAFPNARFFIGKDEFTFWTAPDVLAKLDPQMGGVLTEFVRKNINPIRDRLEFVGHDREILKGITTVAAPGHSPGHLAFQISSKGENLLNVSDVFLHPLHVSNPDWIAMVDYNPANVFSSRISISQTAAETDTLVFAFHFDFPGLGKVQKSDDGNFKWAAQSVNER